MNSTPLAKARSRILHIAKVLFGAWAFAVAGTILTSLVTLSFNDPGSHVALVRYATWIFFLLGIPIMLRWLK